MVQVLDNELGFSSRLFVVVHDDKKTATNRVQAVFLALISLKSVNVYVRFVAEAEIMAQTRRPSLFGQKRTEKSLDCLVKCLQL